MRSSKALGPTLVLMPAEKLVLLTLTPLSIPLLTLPLTLPSTRVLAQCFCSGRRGRYAR